MGKRRKSFYKKIEESTDELLFSKDKYPDSNNIKENIPVDDPYITDTVDINHSIDDLLVNALAAHNKNRFDDAISLYTKILEYNPGDVIRSIIYKHRGMANFASSRYELAIEDFNLAFKYDPASYKALYYRGVVRSVLRQYSQAIDDYTLSLKLHQHQSFCLFRRGQAYYHIGDYPGALADCESSLSLEPNNQAVEKFIIILREKLKM